MKDWFGLYKCYILTFFKARGEYRISFVISMFANFYCYLITFALFGVITSQFGQIANWDFIDMSVLYSLNLLTYSISGMLIWYTVYNLSTLITEGSLDIYLIRPMGLIGQMICHRFGDTFIGQIIVTGFFLTISFYKLIDNLTVSILLYAILAIIGGIMLQCGAMILIGSLSFWTLRSTEIGHILYYDLRSITNYPISIYPKWIKILLTYIFPWAFINYYPSLIILNKPRDGIESILGWIAPIVGIVFLGISLLIFHQGLKRYTSCGN